MARSTVLREQRQEMSNTFAHIREKIADAQRAIRKYNASTTELEEQKEDVELRNSKARAKCAELRNLIADKERDLFDVENQIPLAKVKMHEYESVYGENKYFEKVLERTRGEVAELEKRKEEVHKNAKVRAEDCWQATQKLHKLELQVEDVEKRIDFAMRRIIVARERISAVEAQGNAVSKNYTELSTNEMENKYDEKQQMVIEAKKRRKAAEEQEMKLSWQVEELERQVEDYHDKMREMFSGQRELGSAKIL